MPHEFEFDFDDIRVMLPEYGFPTPPLFGFATVAYWPDGDWHIKGLTLTGYKAGIGEILRTGVYVQKRVAIPPASYGLFFALVECLEESPWRQRLENEVHNQRLKLSVGITE